MLNIDIFSDDQPIEDDEKEAAEEYQGTFNDISKPNYFGKSNRNNDND